MPDHSIALDPDLTVRIPALEDWVTVRLDARRAAAADADTHEVRRPGHDCPPVSRRHRHRQTLAARIAPYVAVAALAFGVAYACLIGWIAAAATP